jgi:hypothetical protein
MILKARSVLQVNVEAQESLQPDAETVEDADGAEELEFDADEGVMGQLPV